MRVYDVMCLCVCVWRPSTFQALRTPGQANTVYQLAISLNNVGRCEEAIEMYTQVRLPMIFWALL